MNIGHGDLSAIGFHPSLKQLDRDCSEGGGMARAGHDDVYAMGPEDVVLPAVQRFADEILQRCGLRLQWSKSKVYHAEGRMPANTPAGITVAGEVINGQFEPGMDCYGCPIGSDNFVSNMLQCRAKEIVKDAVKSVDLLSGDRQAN